MNLEFKEFSGYKTELDGVAAPAEMKTRLKTSLLAELEKDKAAGPISDEAHHQTDNEKSQGQKAPGKPIWKIAAAAAAACIVLAGALFFQKDEPAPDLGLDKGPGTDPDTEHYVAANEFDWENVRLVDGLPLLGAEQYNEGMGGGGLVVYDISEIENGNPWSPGMTLETLPAFWNRARCERSGVIIKGGLNEQEMEEKALEAADALNLEVRRLTQKTESDIMREGSAEVYAVTAECVDATVTVERNGNVEVFFEVTLKDGPVLGSYPDNPASREDYDEVTAELYETFKGVLKWDGLASAVSCDRDIYGETHWWERAFDNTGSLEEQILNFSFKTVSYAVYEEKKVWILRYTDTDLSEKLGDYPIISLEEAEEALLAGRYLSYEGDYKPEDGTVLRVDLEYLNHKYQEYFIPYYKFYVELPQYYEDYDFLEKLDGPIMYAAFYVPAVEAKYLSVVDDAEIYFN